MVVVVVYLGEKRGLRGGVVVSVLDYVTAVAAFGGLLLGLWAAWRTLLDVDLPRFHGRDG